MNKSIVEIEDNIQAYISEARALLADLPDEITFVWDNNLIIPGNGTGGTLIEPSILGLGYDLTFEDHVSLERNLRATVLHECYHAVQGWSDIKPIIEPETLLEDGILEGAATVFERQYGGTSPLWSAYEEDDIMKKWLVKIEEQNLEPNSAKYNDYKFGEINGTKWMLYKLGTWIIDKALEKNSDLSIEQLANIKPKEIFKLAGI